MSLPTLEVRHYRVELITDHYLLAGLLEPFGTLMTYLNNPERKTVHLKNVSISALDVTSTVNTFVLDEVWVRREEIMMIQLLDPVSPATVPLLPFREKLRVFTERFAVQAHFSRGEDTKLSDIFEAHSGEWVPGIAPQVYPLLPTKPQLTHEVKMLLLSKSHIQFYQPVRE